MIARFASSGAATVLTVRSRSFPSRRRPSCTGSPGAIFPMASTSPRGVSTGLSLCLDDHVAAAEGLRRRNVDRDGLDERAPGRGVDVEPRLAERDGRGDLLRPLHVLPCPHPPLSEGLSGRRDRVRRNERRALGANERQQLLEPACLPHPDVDEVDAACLVLALVALDLDLSRDRARLVRDVEDSRRSRSSTARRRRLRAARRRRGRACAA